MEAKNNVTISSINKSNISSIAFQGITKKEDIIGQVYAIREGWLSPEHSADKDT